MRGNLQEIEIASASPRNDSYASLNLGDSSLFKNLNNNAVSGADNSLLLSSKSVSVKTGKLLEKYGGNHVLLDGQEVGSEIFSLLEAEFFSDIVAVKLNRPGG